MKTSSKTILKFAIPNRIPSLNDYTSLCRGHRHAAARSKREIENGIVSIVRGLTGQISRPVWVSFVWYEQTRRRDKDNVAFAKKFILDAMQKAGILKNDNNRFIAGFTDTFVYGQGDKVEVEITEVDNCDTAQKKG